MNVYKKEVMKVNLSLTDFNSKKNTSHINNNEHNNANVNFKGVGSVPVCTMDFLVRGGLCATFMAQDFCGMIAPRIVTGFYRNKDKTGQYNYGEASEVAIREIATGPPMFMIPMAGLYAFKRVFGKACDVPMDFIDTLGSIYKKNTNSYKGSSEQIKKAFYTDVMKNVVASSLGDTSDSKLIEETAQTYVNDILEIETKKSKSLYKKLINKPDPKSATDKTQKLLDKFVKLRKQHSVNPSENFHSFTITTPKSNSTGSFEQLLSNMRNYAEDIIETTKKKGNSPYIIETFNENRKNLRSLTNIAMMVAVAGFCMIIPKLYQIHDTNPGLKGLINEDENNNSKSPKNSQMIVHEFPAPKIDYFRLPFKKVSARIQTKDVGGLNA